MPQKNLPFLHLSTIFHTEESNNLTFMGGTSIIISHSCFADKCLLSVITCAQINKTSMNTFWENSKSLWLSANFLEPVTEFLKSKLLRQIQTMNGVQHNQFSHNCLWTMSKTHPNKVCITIKNIARAVTFITTLANFSIFKFIELSK